GCSIPGQLLSRLVAGALNVLGAYHASLAFGEPLTVRDGLQAFTFGAILGGRGLMACFTGDMEVPTRRGFVRWDALTGNDEVLSCNEHDPLGALEYKRVEEIFRTTAPIWHVHVKGKVIRTTARHPFYVWGKGWIEAWRLAPGDRLRSDDGRMVAVEEVFESGTEEPVYNCRVADYHTYFVGGAEWEVTVWAHNQCYISQAAANTGRKRAGLIRNRNPAKH